MVTRSHDQTVPGTELWEISACLRLQAVNETSFAGVGVEQEVSLAQRVFWMKRPRSWVTNYSLHPRNRVDQSQSVHLPCLALDHDFVSGLSVVRHTAAASWMEKIVRQASAQCSVIVLTSNSTKTCGFFHCTRDSAFTYYLVAVARTSWCANHTAKHSEYANKPAPVLPISQSSHVVLLEMVELARIRNNANFA